MDIVQLLTFAIDNGAEHVLISPGSPPILRRQGKLMFTKMDPLTGDDTRGLVYAALSAAESERLEMDRELSFTFFVREGCQCLGSAYYERGALSAVFRIAPAAAALPAKLGLPSLVADAARAERGLVIVAAPPGHGKSTALASLIELINTEREATVLSIEDTIIYPHADKKSVVHQREVGRDTLSIVAALNVSARQDPDVLVIDPMNEPEAIRKALAFAGRGHLVIAAMEADYVVDALDMLLGAAEGGADAVSIRRQLAAELTLIAALRLLPRKDGPGRVPATEVLKVEADIASHVRSGDKKALAKLMRDPNEARTWTLDSFILKLHERGLVDTETALRYLLEPNLLER